MSTRPRDFLVEIGTEELPPLALRDLERSLCNSLASGLSTAGLRHGELRSFATPRRLAVLVKGLSAEQPEQTIKRRGPPVGIAFDAAGQPTRAAQAFASSCGVSVDALERMNEGNAQFLFFSGVRRGAKAIELLPEIVQVAIGQLPIPKRMRWGAGSAEFVRPVHWIVMLYGTDVIPAMLLEVRADRITYGHRFLAPKPLRLSTASSYDRRLLNSGRVIADFEARRALVHDEVSKKASEAGGHALLDPLLLDEVTALVEWPVALAGRFEERFLQLPREVLISTLQDHQRYFAVRHASGSLLPCFITVTNIDSREPDRVREGNERVVRPRLADAAFFWDLDRKQTLASFGDTLKQMSYQANLGSLHDKAMRVGALATKIATAINGEPELVARAAELCKCDLATAMVGEFPELQGVMGRYYALADGEVPEVASAIQEHYQPRGSTDDLPETKTGVAIAVADKLDTVAGVFAIGQKPSGTKDPFGLRRAAIGVLRISLEKAIDLDLCELIEAAVAQQPVQKGNVAQEVYMYVMERLRAYYLERNAESTGAAQITTEMFDAVLATQPRSAVDFDARLRALGAFLQMPEAASLTAANKRIANILRKAGEAPMASVDTGALRETAEVRLYEALHMQREPVEAASARREYTTALGQLAQLREPVDVFFDQVMVMDEDTNRRTNRLALLGQLRQLFGGIADLSRLPG